MTDNNQQRRQLPASRLLLSSSRPSRRVLGSPGPGTKSSLLSIATSPASTHSGSDSDVGKLSSIGVKNFSNTSNGGSSTNLSTMANSDNSDVGNQMECPICGIAMTNLNQLNQHIDDNHLVIDGNSTSLDTGNSDSSNNNIFDEDVIKSWIRNKIKIPNVKIFENNNISLNNINSSLLNINDLILTPNSSSSSLSDLAHNEPGSWENRSKANLRLSKKYRVQMIKSIDKSKWQKLSPRHSTPCSIAICNNLIRYRQPNNNTANSGSASNLNGLKHMHSNSSVPITSNKVNYSIENYENNCFSCGKVFCLKHLPTFMKINSNGVYDPDNGLWFRVCLNCYQSKLGYVINQNSSGTCMDITKSFQRQRSMKVEAKRLEHLKIYKRIETYLCQLIDIYYEYYFGSKGFNNKIAKLMIFNESKRKLTNSIMRYWQDDSEVSACEVCSDEFNKLLLRKHHCRLCGSVVCDNNCSMEVPVTFLIPLVISANKTRPSVEQLNKFIDKFNDSETLRICLNCKSLLFKRKTFESDLLAGGSRIVHAIESLLSIKARIELLMPKFRHLLIFFEEQYIDTIASSAVSGSDPTSQASINNKQNGSEDEIMKLLENLRKTLLKLLTSFEKASKTIMLIQPLSSNSAQLIQSIKTFALNYLQIQTNTLKKFQELLLKRQKLSKNSIKVINDNQTATKSNAVYPVSRSVAPLQENIAKTDKSNETPADNTISVIRLNEVPIPVKEIKELREELMILKEQQFLIQNMIDASKKERKFDEVVTLNENRDELESRIKEINDKLGDEYSFA